MCCFRYSYVYDNNYRIFAVWSFQGIIFQMFFYVFVNVHFILIEVFIPSLGPSWLWSYQGLINPLAWRAGLVISTFGLAEIISCMPNGLIKNIYRILTNLSIFAYLLIFIYIICCLISSNVLFIQPLAFLSKLRAKKVEKLCNSS